MAFFGGSTGVIYRQFSMTLVCCHGAIVAGRINLTPALCAALILKPNDKSARWATWFNLKLDQLKTALFKVEYQTIQHSKIMLVVFVALIAVFALFYRALPTSFIPSEDQGILSVQFKLADGATH